MASYPATWLRPAWWVARDITRFLRTIHSSGAVLHLGCGTKYIPGAINCDLHNPAAADRQWDATCLPDVSNCSIDVIEHHHLIEHLAAAELDRGLAEWSRVLKPGGLLVVSAPDLERVMRRWLGMREADRWGYGIKMVYGSQEHEGMFHKNGFTPERWAELLPRFGFQQEWYYRGYPRRPTPSFISIARKK